MELSREEHVKLKIWAVNKGTTLQAIFAEAIANWMAVNIEGQKAKVAK